MGLILNGNAPSKMLYNGAEVSLYFNGSKIWPESLGPIPSNTVRVRTNDGNAPIKEADTTYETATLVSGTTDVYDVYKSGTNFSHLLFSSTNVVEVLGANTTGITNMNAMFSACNRLTTVSLFDTSNVTDMGYMFAYSKLTTVPLFDTSNVTNMTYMFNTCTSLTTVPLFDTSSVTNMNGMFIYCQSLKSIPLFVTSSVTNMSGMFYGCSSLTIVPLFDTSNVTTMYNMFNSCYKVESGALLLYQQASTQATPPSSHTNAFLYCGRDTVTGAAELAQIPTSWGGTMS